MTRSILPSLALLIGCDEAAETTSYQPQIDALSVQVEDLVLDNLSQDDEIAALVTENAALAAENAALSDEIATLASPPLHATL